MLVQFVKQSLNHLTEEARAAAGDAPAIFLPGPARNHIAMAWADDSLYVAGGYTGAASHYGFYRMKMSGVYETLADCPLFNNTVYLLFPYNGDLFLITESGGDLVALRYDKGTDTWQELAHQVVTGGWWIGCVYNGEAYLGSWDSSAGELYCYDPATDTWTTLTGDPFRAIMTVYNGKLISGIRMYHSAGKAKYYQGLRVYDPGTDSWSDFPASVPIATQGVRPYKGGVRLFTVQDTLFCVLCYSTHLADRTMQFLDTALFKWDENAQDWVPVFLHPRLRRLIGGFYLDVLVTDRYVFFHTGQHLTHFTTSRFAPVVAIPVSLLVRW